MSAEEQVEALARVMSPAMGDECTLDELRAYATRILASDWLASLLDEARAEGRREALDEVVEVVKRACDIECYSPGKHTGCAHHEPYRRLLAALGEEGR